MNTSPLLRTGLALILAVLALTAIGLVVIYSASHCSWLPRGELSIVPSS